MDQYSVQSRVIQYPRKIQNWDHIMAKGPGEFARDS